MASVFARPDPQNPWSVDPDGYPRHARGAEQLHFLLRFAVLAPSTHNSQPWRFRVVDDETVEVWSDPARWLRRIDGAGRQLAMSCGAAVFHLRLGVRRYGNVDDVEYLPDRAHPELVARIHRGRRITPSTRDLELFTAIPRRRTYRDPFRSHPVSAELSEALTREAGREGAWLVRLHPQDQLDVARVIAGADRRQLADPVFRSELGEWLTPRGSRRRDGIPMDRKDVPTALPVVGPALLRAFDLGQGVAARELDLAAQAPILAVLGTELDEVCDWVTAGEAMEAVLLRATQLGLSASFLNQAIEERDLRRPIGAAARAWGVPQLVLRFGWGGEVPPTPRRDVEEVTWQEAMHRR